MMFLSGSRERLTVTGSPAGSTATSEQVAVNAGAMNLMEELVNHQFIIQLLS